MNKRQLQQLSQNLTRISQQLADAARDTYGYPEDVIVSRCQTCERRHAFDNERGRVVQWDGDLWLLNEWEDAIMPLGHSRGSRMIVHLEEAQEGDLTLADLENV